MKCLPILKQAVLVMIITFLAVGCAAPQAVPTQPASLPTTYAGITVDGGYRDWASYDPIAEDAKGDQFPGAADLITVRALNDDQYFYIQIRLSETGETTRYEILLDVDDGSFDYQVVLLMDEERYLFGDYPGGEPQPLAGMAVAVGEEEMIEVGIPLSAMGGLPVQGLRVQSYAGTGIGDTLDASPVAQISPDETVVIEGIIADCRHPFGALVGISNAEVRLDSTAVRTDDDGHFSLTLPSREYDTPLEITAKGYVPYAERPSNMVAGAFHLIPEDLYRGMYLIIWNQEPENPSPWHRKWEQQTEFIIVTTGASEEQLTVLLDILATDRYRDMTGGRFTSALPPTLVETMPPDGERRGKTIISFAEDIIEGGIAASMDESGVIYTAYITYDYDQVMGPTIIWHEMVHTITAGGHIQEWPSVVSASGSLGGNLSQIDIEIFNCIYNSPPLRAMPAYTP